MPWVSRGELRKTERRDEALLALIREQANQIMHLSNKTWTPPPRTVEPAPEAAASEWLPIT